MIALGLLWILSTPFVSDLLLEPLEVDPVPLSPDATYSTVVVLGGMTNSYMSRGEVPELTAAVDRLLNGVDLVQKGRAPKLLFTGGSGDLLGQDVSEGQLIGEYLQNLLPADQFMVETKSRNTWENALYSRPLLENPTRDNPAILVTSAFHMRRSIGCFQKAGIPVVPYPVDYRQLKLRGFYNFLPDEEALENSAIVAKELLGLLVYNLRGYN